MDKQNLKTFKTIKEAKEYGKRENFSKYDYEKIVVNGEHVILCGTPLAYEDEVHGQAYELVKHFYKYFGYESSCGFWDLADRIRDLVLDNFEKDCKVKFVELCDEY